MGSSASGERLRVEGLWRRLGGRPVLRGVDLSVSAGGVVGLLGPNGAGKTTTFRLIAGLDRAEGGRVVLEGRDLEGLPLHRRVGLGLGYLPQEPSVFRGLTAVQNVAVALEVGGRPEPRRGAERMLERFGLSAVGAQRASTLSGGERRRLELARAVALEPRVLVCDEPLTGVDPMAAAELRELLRSLAAEGMAVLLTDHNVAEALPACDRAALLVEGVVVEEGTAGQLANSERAKRLYLGEGWGGGLGRPGWRDEAV